MVLTDAGGDTDEGVVGEEVGEQHIEKGVTARKNMVVGFLCADSADKGRMWWLCGDGVGS